MNKNIKKIVSVDVGFGFVKAVNGKRKQVSFPSVYKRSSKIISKSLGSKKDYEIKINETSYFVGNLALHERAKRVIASQQTFDKERYLVLLSTAISKLVNDGDEIELRVGLPIRDFFGNEEKIDELGRFLKNKEIKTELCGVLKSFKLNAVKVLPQGYGAYLYMRSINRASADEIAGIIDIGYRTVDYIMLEDNEVISTATGSLEESGMHYIYKKICEDYELKTGEKMRLKYAEKKLLKNKAINHIDTTEIIQKHAIDIASEINSVWADIDMVDKIFLVGGGSKKISKILSQKLRQNKKRIFEIEETRTQFANALGYQAV